MRVYVEYGWPYICSTEWECPTGVEIRVRGKNIPDRYTRSSVYLRIQLGHKVLVLDGKSVQVKRKPYCAIKILLGFGYAEL